MISYIAGTPSHWQVTSESASSTGIVSCNKHLQPDCQTGHSLRGDQWQGGISESSLHDTSDADSSTLPHSASRSLGGLGGAMCVSPPTFTITTWPAAGVAVNGALALVMDVSVAVSPGCQPLAVVLPLSCSRNSSRMRFDVSMNSCREMRRTKPVD